MSAIRFEGDAGQRTLRLRDGRRLGFAEWGSPNGKPIVVFVGGSSRLVYPSIAPPDVRLITVDRPGLGLSDFHPGRRLLYLPDDVTQLLDALDLPQAAVAGISQGGPSALACAYRIPERLVAVGAVSSLAPPEFFERAVTASGPPGAFSRLAMKQPAAFRLQSAIAAWMVAWLGPRWTFRQVLKSLPPADRAVFEARPELIEMFVADLWECYRQGSRGSAQEGLLAYRPWGFQLEAIRTRVYVWHGASDRSVPVAMARYLAGAIPHCLATIVPNEGHFVGMKYWSEIAHQLVSSAL